MISRNLLVLFLLSFTSCALSDDQSKLNSYGSLPDAQTIEISPKGNKLAILSDLDDLPIVLIKDLSRPNSKPVAIRLTGTKPRSLTWIDENYILALASVTQDVTTTKGLKKMEFSRWLAINLEDYSLRPLFKNEKNFYIGASGKLLSVLPNEPGIALFSRISIGRGLSVFKVNLKTGETYRTHVGNSNTLDWLVDSIGNVKVRVDFTNSGLELLSKSDDEFVLESTLDVAPSHFFGFSDESERFYVKHNSEQGLRALGLYDVNSNSIVKTVFSAAPYDIKETIYSPIKGKVIGIRYTDHFPRIHHLNKRLNKLQESFGEVLGAQSVNIVSISNDKDKMIVETLYSDHPPQFFLYQKKANKLDLIVGQYPSIEGKITAKKLPFDYVAKDGLTIPGYLTLPNKRNEALPLIVLPHGGPAERDNQSFDWWAFFYAAHGYAVYQPNFRGSSGYGNRFQNAGLGEWGKNIRTDIDDGVRELIDQDIVDSERICIAGASFGGYASLSGGIFSEGLYKCAVSINGVTDLLYMLGYAHMNNIFSEAYWNLQLGGDRFDSDDKISAISPVANVDKINIPIMLIHARDDTIVKYAVSRKMSIRMEKAGKKHEFITLEGEDHWLSKGETRRQMLNESLMFIEKHIGNSGE